jgi:hypothetical protein
MYPVKASLLDDDSFRLLAFPFSGPIPMPGTRGVDLDGQYFSRATDIKADWLPFRPTDWHHGNDVTMRRTVLGKAIDLGRRDGPAREPDEDGWWVTVWLDAGQRRLDLIKRLADRGAQLFGSSETLPGVATVKARDGSIQPWRAGLAGEIMAWPYWRQTLSTSPQNTHSVLRPLKATLDDIEAAGERPGATFWSDVEDALRSLGHSLRESSATGTPGAKAGHERELRSALDRLNAASDRVAAIITT